jgi:outer membrane receptor for monomeric catechols
MIKESYVSFETANLLKKKGFKGEVQRWYTQFEEVADTQNIPHDYIDCPSLQMAMKWLREEKSLFIEISHESKDNFIAGIYDMTEEDKYGDYKFYPPLIAMCKTYEQACEAAIKCCLENLI